MKKNCLILACAVFAAMALCAGAAPFAYVPNEESGTISVIDTSTDKVVKEIRAGDKPRGLFTKFKNDVLVVAPVRLVISDHPHSGYIPQLFSITPVIAVIDCDEFIQALQRSKAHRRGNLVRTHWRQCHLSTWTKRLSLRLLRA